MPKDFIIKPATIRPSTFSQIGTVLIPSKKCNNRKIARKYSEKGATSILSTDTGIRSLSNTNISTFKRFDRPSPMISRNCQSCNMLTIPSVTDKTAYPCSLGKYSVTRYANVKNTIDPNYTYSNYPRIITSNNQLYQQYRVTDKNNIVKDQIPNSCPDCQYEIETGVYTGAEEPIYIINKGNCQLCFIVEKSDIGEFNYNGGCVWSVNSSSLEATADNQLTTSGGIGDNTLNKSDSQTLSGLNFSEGQVILPPAPGSGSCSDQTINVSWNGTELTINDITNGVSETFTEGVNTIPNNENIITIYFNSQQAFYSFVLIGNIYYLVAKANCECGWERIIEDRRCSLTDIWSTEDSGGFPSKGNGVAYDGNGRWVAVGNSGVSGGNTILYSDNNGETWSLPDSGSDIFTFEGRGVAYGGNGLWVAVGGFGVSGGNVILYSEDNGKNWSLPDSGSASFQRAGYGVAYGNGRWVAVGVPDNSPTRDDILILYSDNNGKTWISSNYKPPPGGRTLYGVAYGNNGRWVAVGIVGFDATSASILYSEDNGINWSPPDSGPMFTSSGYGVAYNGNGMWVAVGSNSGSGGGNTILYSEDNGKNWSLPDSGSASFQSAGYGVAYCENGLWVAVGIDTFNDNIKILHSENGKYWNITPITIETRRLLVSKTLAFGNGKLIIPGSFENNGNEKSFLINDIEFIP